MYNTDSKHLLQQIPADETDDLFSVLAEVKGILAEVRKHAQMSWSEEEAADLLGVSLLTLQRLRRAGMIGYTPVGGKARYTRRHIENYLEANSQEPITTKPKLRAVGPTARR